MRRRRRVQDREDGDGALAPRPLPRRACRGERACGGWPGARWCRARRARERLPRLLHRGLLARGSATRPTRMGRWRALGARSKADHASRCAPARGCARRRWWRSAAATARCSPSSARAALAPVLDGFELSPPAAELARARAIPGARRIEAFDGARRPGRGRRLRPRGALARARARPGADAAAARGGAGGAGGAASRCRSRTTARPAARRSAPRRRASGTSSSSTARRCTRSSACAGLQVAAELSDPLPYAHHAFFAETRGGAGARGAQERACGGRRGARRPSWRSGSSPCTTACAGVSP